MFGLGMTEIFCFAVIALLVLGPDKLPEAIRFVAKWYGKIKKLLNNMQNEIDRELRLSEFRDEIQKEIEKITELERKMQRQLDALQQTQSTNQVEEVSAPLKDLKTYYPCSHRSHLPFSVQYHSLFPQALEENRSNQAIDHHLKIAL